MTAWTAGGCWRASAPALGHHLHVIQERPSDANKVTPFKAPCAVRPHPSSIMPANHAS